MGPRRPQIAGGCNPRGIERASPPAWCHFRLHAVSLLAETHALFRRHCLPHIGRREPPHSPTPRESDPFDLWSLQYRSERPSRPPKLLPADAKWVSNAGGRVRPGEIEGEKPGPFALEADRRTLIRRVYFDLVGLPPTPEEVDAFLKDPDPTAYEKLVDRLLASPAYGERWARHWLDVVHYGDTHGYDKDKPRPNAWPYRDYVIRAFNEDKPYDRFVKEQLAGDSFYPDTRRRHCRARFPGGGAVGFRRPGEMASGRWKGPRGNIDRDDMVANTMNTFVSLTAQCALPRPQVRSDHAGGLLHPAGGVRRGGPGRPAV